MVAGTIGLLAVAAALLAIDPSPSATGGDGTQFAGSIRPPGPPLEFRLADERGEPVRLSALRGRPAIVTFMYTTCENDCPTMAQQIRGALDDLGSEDEVPVIAVSVDPAGDTPERARRFLAEQRLAGRMRFALGDRAQLQPAWRAFGVQPQERGREHAAWVVLLDRQGRQRIGFPADKLTSEGVEHDVRALLAER
jgi:protein SCO1/2